MYKQGDILIDGDGDRRKVLGVCGDVLFLSLRGKYDVYGWTITINLLNNKGYKLYTDKPAFKIDDKVLVRNFENEDWAKRYFAGWGKDGRIQTWSSGRTSWNEYGEVTWSFYKLLGDEQ